MGETTAVDPAIAEMPRGGPDAWWLDFLPSAARFGPASNIVVFSSPEPTESPQA